MLACAANLLAPGLSSVFLSFSFTKCVNAAGVSVQSLFLVRELRKSGRRVREVTVDGGCILQADVANTLEAGEGDACCCCCSRSCMSRKTGIRVTDECQTCIFFPLVQTYRGLYLGCRLIVGIKIVLFGTKVNSLIELQMFVVAPHHSVAQV